MAASKAEGWVRLGIGVALNACLWPLASGLAVWSDYDREFRLVLLAGVVAVATTVAVIPIFWRGQPWQAPLAFLLLWLPAFAFYAVLTTIAS